MNITGFFAPVLSYGLMSECMSCFARSAAKSIVFVSHTSTFLLLVTVALIFSFMAPIMLGVCALFFWVATKVHTHNALFVYCQRCEGGGKIFYYWNRIVFITLYSSIVVFSAILALKQYAELGLTFVFIMTIVTYCIDKSVENTFVIHSLHLPLMVARIHDEEEVRGLVALTHNIFHAIPYI